MISPVTGFSGISHAAPVRSISRTAAVTAEPAEAGAAPGLKTPSSNNMFLPSSGALQLSSAVLGVLQSTSQTGDLLASPGGGRDQGIASLLGGRKNTENLLDTIFSGASGGSGSPFSDLLRQASTRFAPLQEAVNAALQERADSRAQSSPVQNMLADFHSASNAYNKVALQNAQNALAAGETRPLVA